MIKQIFLFVVMLSTCITAYAKPLINSFSNKEQVPESDQIAMKCMDKTNETLCSRYHMKSYGFGMSGNLDHLSLDFQISRSLDKNEARAIIFDCVEEFLNNINSNENLKTCLNPYPFNVTNITIILYITDENRRDLMDPDISVARFSDNGVTFLTNDPDNLFRYKNKFKETYEEALELVKKYREVKSLR